MFDSICSLEMYLDALLVTGPFELFSYSLDVRHDHVGVYVLLSVVAVLVVVVGMFIFLGGVVVM